MKCFSPISIKRPGGDNVFDRILVPCGRCDACVANKRNSWTVRLKNEQREHNTAVFLTLTYSEENVYRNEKGELSVNKRDVQLFLKRLRKNLKGRYIKYYLISEYGGSFERPHYHALIFNVNYLNDYETIQKSWSNGFVHFGKLEPASIAYVANYAFKKSDRPENADKNFALMSKGIGVKYTEYNKTWHVDGDRFFMVLDNGVKQALPRYYREKIFSREQIENRPIVLPRELTEDQINDYVRKCNKIKQQKK